MNNRERKLYYQPTDIIINREILQLPHVKELYSRIVKHEIEGLVASGGVATIGEKFTTISNPTNGLSFYNRVLEINTTADDFNAQYSLLAPPCSFEINPFTSPKNIEEILTNIGAHHTLSTIVLSKQINSKTQIDDTHKLDIRLVSDSKSVDDAFSLFSTFFLKPNELLQQGKERFVANIHKGPHFIAYNDNKVVATIGSIIMGNTASVYSGMVVPEYRRGSDLTLNLCQEIENSLLNQGVDFYYYKTRNKAVARGSRMFLKLVHLYNERIYEKT